MKTIYSINISEVRYTKEDNETIEVNFKDGVYSTFDKEYTEVNLIKDK